MQLHVLSFLVPQKNYLNATAVRKVYEVSKDVAALEIGHLQNNNDAVQEIVGSVNGALENLSSSSLKALEKIGPTVKKLDLHNFALTVSMLKKIVSCFPHLKYLSVRGAGLSDAHMIEIAKLKSLESLDLSHNHITNKGLKKLSVLVSLHTLLLEKCEYFNDKIR